MGEVLYGRNPVYECLRAGRRKVRTLWLAEGLRDKRTWASLARRAGAGLRYADRRRLDALCEGANHQGVVAEAGEYPYATVNEMLELASARGEKPWLLLLDCLQDPQNLGTLLRTAEVVGVHGVVIPRRRAVRVTPAVVNASSGASEHLLIARVTNLARTIGELQEREVWVAGLEGVPEARVLWDADLRGALALVVGSEGRGLRRLVRERCDFVLRLPMRGHINSLNAAVAGSVALYEVARQRGAF